MREDRVDETPVTVVDNRYLMLVGGLLLIISLTLGYLWQAERARRITTEGRIAALEQRVAQLSRELALARTSAAGGGKGPKTFTLPPGVPLESFLKNMPPPKTPESTSPE